MDLVKKYEELYSINKNQAQCLDSMHLTENNKYITKKKFKVSKLHEYKFDISCIKYISSNDTDIKIKKLMQILSKLQIIEYSIINKNKDVLFNEKNFSFELNLKNICLNLDNNNNYIISINSGYAMSLQDQTILFISQEITFDNIYIQPIAIDARDNGLVYFHIYLEQGFQILESITLQCFLFTIARNLDIKNNITNKPLITKQKQISNIWNLPMEEKISFDNYPKHLSKHIIFNEHYNIIIIPRKRNLIENESIVNVSGYYSKQKFNIHIQGENSSLCMFSPKIRMDPIFIKVSKFKKLSPRSGLNGNISFRDNYKNIVEIFKNLFNINKMVLDINDVVNSWGDHNDEFFKSNLKRILYITQIKATKGNNMNKIKMIINNMKNEKIEYSDNQILDNFSIQNYKSIDDKISEQNESLKNYFKLKNYSNTLEKIEEPTAKRNCENICSNECKRQIAKKIKLD